ncbi:hypothetical protein CGT93_10390 [Vibrio metoecus]|uniref:hypothetical protein n=1 Tax=Vibrio metoecus TaxID=1481663 RepID=UPI000BA8F1A6|nr:hypothetical protein [Vibrio metoecus]PAR54054.1 hypothetical protein CGT93_10390 [Vibrio metoecus]
MNPLFNANGEQIPARPSWRKDKETIIKMAMETLFAEKYCDFEECERFPLQQSLLKQLSMPSDEYELAKDFEDDGWSVCSTFLSKLDNVIGHLQHAYQSLEQSWGQEHKPVPPFQNGDQLILWGQVGEITGVCEHRPATFLVKQPKHDENTRLLIKFEDAVKVNP